MRFRQLIEGRDAPLYHATSGFNAVKIIQENQLAAKTIHYSRHMPFLDQSDVRVFGVSLTRSRRAADQFGSVIFELNQRKLASNYKIEPLDYWGYSFEPPQGRRRGNYAEAEEFVPTTIRNVDRYIVAIHVSKFGYTNLLDGGEYSRPLLDHPKLVLPAEIQARVPSSA